ncbi:MAG: hypothetical protein ACYTEO_19845 [Planctomycetota bacterium]|jgi:hypothetical protein
MDRYEIHNFYTEEWKDFEKRQRTKGVKALNFLIDVLCHAGLVRPVEVRDDEWDDVSDIVYESRQRGNSRCRISSAPNAGS